MPALDVSLATTRMLTSVRPPLTSRIPGVQETLFLPPNPDCAGEGGLRRRGCFKAPCPGKPLITVVTVVRNQRGYRRDDRKRPGAGL